MGSAFHQLCPRYSGTLTPNAPTAIRLWDTFTFLVARGTLHFFRKWFWQELIFGMTTMAFDLGKPSPGQKSCFDVILQQYYITLGNEISCTKYQLLGF